MTSQSDMKHELQDYYSKLFAIRTVNEENRNVTFELLLYLSEDRQQLLEPAFLFENSLLLFRIVKMGKTLDLMASRLNLRLSGTFSALLFLRSCRRVLNKVNCH